MAQLPGMAKWEDDRKEPSFLELNKGKIYRMGLFVFISKELTDKWNMLFIDKGLTQGFYMFSPDQYETLRKQKVFLPTYEELPQIKYKGENK